MGRKIRTTVLLSRLVWFFGYQLRLPHHLVLRLSLPALQIPCQDVNFSKTKGMICVWKVFGGIQD